VKTYVDPHLTVDNEISLDSGGTASHSNRGNSVPQSSKQTLQQDDVNAIHTTIKNVTHSLNVILSRNSDVLSFAEATTARAQALLAAYLPAVLQYLPDKKVGKEFIFLLALMLLVCALFYLGAGQLLVSVTGLLYPTYATIGAVADMEKRENKVCYPQ